MTLPEDESAFTNFNSETFKSVQNTKLADTFHELYRGPGIGNGGAADALRWEARTGLDVNGEPFAEGTLPPHFVKVVERITNLQRIIKTQDLSWTDQQYAYQELANLQDALSVTEQWADSDQLRAPPVGRSAYDQWQAEEHEVRSAGGLAEFQSLQHESEE